MGVFPVDRMNNFPYGLGNKSASLTIYSQPLNKGGLVVNVPLPDEGLPRSAMQNNNVTIDVVRFGDLFLSDKRLPPSSTAH
jgi:hypothetical protein